jgi:adenine deaminase
MSSSNQIIDISLHDHLDGSYPMLNILPYLHRLTHGDKKTYPFNQWSDHQRQVTKWFMDGGLHSRLPEKFALTTGVMQNPVTIFEAAKNYTLIRGRQGFKYCEATIAPQYHVYGDRTCRQMLLNEKDIVGILIEGIKEGERQHKEESGNDIKVNILFGIGREVTVDMATRLVNIAGACSLDRVRGISLVCDEPDNPPDKFIDIYLRAHELGLKTTCHVEFVKNRTPAQKDTPEKINKNIAQDVPKLIENLRTAIFKLKVNRIDHGFGLAEDPELMKVVADRQIGITVCPGSLIATNTIHNVRQLKIRELLENSVLVTLDCDDDLFMPDLKEVFRMYEDAYNRPPTCENLDLLKEEKQKLIQNAWSIKWGA